MCDLSVDLAAACRLHGRPANHFAGELRRLAELERDGIVEVVGSRVLIPEAARPLMRLAAAAFDSYLASAPAAHAKAV